MYKTFFATTVIIYLINFIAYAQQFTNDNKTIHDLHHSSALDSHDLFLPEEFYLMSNTLNHKYSSVPLKLAERLQNIYPQYKKPNKDDISLTPTNIPFDLNNYSNRISGDVTEAWVKHYTSFLHIGFDWIYAMAIDSADGSIYVTGSSDSAHAGSDYLTIKYSSQGSLLWIARYNGTGSYNDVATAIAVDNLGNVYITGYSANALMKSDYATIKYSSNGEVIWVARYSGPGNENDAARAIAVDDAGNVYVTGNSFGLGTNQDYATIKYNSIGDEIWVARYNGTGNNEDFARSIAVNDLGEIIITGYSFGNGTNFDYTTIKYNNDGTDQWIARYNGIGNNDDRASALTINDSGHVFVTGYSVGSGSGSDCVTIKYNSSGEVLWISRYNGPGNDADEATAIAIDDSGNVFITGRSKGSGTHYDYVTIKYDVNGFQKWISRYNGPGNYVDYPFAISLNNLGEVIITGYSYNGQDISEIATIKYNLLGEEQWVVRFGGPQDGIARAVAVLTDGLGDIYVAGASTVNNQTYDFDYTTIKYNTNGEQQWIVRYDGPGTSEGQAYDLALDKHGNVFVTGWSQDSVQGLDYTTISYDYSGETQWVARYSASDNNWEKATAIVVDLSGNVYVTGLSNNSVTENDYATIKYNSNGQELWVARYDGSVNGNDQPTAIKVDGSGNVYVTGFSENSSFNYDYLTVKYNSDGEELWTARYDGLANEHDEAADLAIDLAGNVYITGSCGSTNPAYTTIKYNSDGESLWIKNHDEGYATAIKLDYMENVYVTGGSGWDYKTIKYSADGIEQWVKTYDGPANDWDFATALAVDMSENVYVTGFSYGLGTNLDYATIKYNSNGDEEWVVRYDGPFNSGDAAADITIDKLGNIYVTGSSIEFGSSEDFATIKYKSNGVEEWVARYNGPGNSVDYATSLAVDSSGNVFVTGYSFTFLWSVYTTIKYEQKTSGIYSEEVPPNLYWLSQNYPNPFNPITKIEFRIADFGFVNLKVFDVLGKEIASLVNEEKPAGEYEVEFNAASHSGNVRNLPSGIYFYQLKAGEFVETRKMILIK